MAKLAKFLFYYLLGLIGVVFVSNAPVLLQGEHWLNFSAYFSNTWTLTKDIVQPDKWIYFYLDRELNILTFLWNPFKYSMTLLGGGLLLGFSLAFLLAILTLFLPQSMINWVKRLLGMLESVPDLMVAFIVQIVIVYIFKRTGIMLMDFVTVGSERIYLLPIIVLSILPMISLYRIVILLMEEELTKSYVEFARSKGVKYNIVLIVHVLRNIMKSVFFHSKIIIWTSLSSLFVIEYMFNINGVSNFIMEDFRPIVITIVLWMIFTPLYFIYQGTEIFIFKDAYNTRVVNNKRGNTKNKTTIQWRMPTITWKGLPIWKWIKQAGTGLWTHLKNLKFLIGFGVIMAILAISIVHSIVQDPSVEQFVLVYDDDGNLLSSKPHPPSEYVPMGSDYLGYSILDQLLSGAKYTILFTSFVALLRMVFGFLFAIPYAMVVSNRWKKVIEKFVDSFHFLPLTIIAIILLMPILTGSTSGFTYSFTERIIMEAAILTLLVIPQLSVLLGNEMHLIMQSEFITGARVLGGNNRHILTRHIMPHLSSKLGVVFGQQFIQVILLLIHLGLFRLFLGGTSVMYDQFYKAPPHSVTFEWSGILSNTRTALQAGQYWIILPVFAAFIIVIVAMQLIVEGIQEVQQERVGVTVRKSKFLQWLFSRKRKNQQGMTDNQPPVPEQFTFINHSENIKRM